MFECVSVLFAFCSCAKLSIALSNSDIETVSYCEWLRMLKRAENLALLNNSTNSILVRTVRNKECIDLLAGANSEKKSPVYASFSTHYYAGVLVVSLKHAIVHRLGFWKRCLHSL